MLSAVVVMAEEARIELAVCFLQILALFSAWRARGVCMAEGDLVVQLGLFLVPSPASYRQGMLSASSDGAGGCSAGLSAAAAAYC